MDRSSNLKNYRSPQKPPQAATSNDNPPALNSTPAQDRTRLVGHTWIATNPSSFHTTNQPEASKASSSNTHAIPTGANVNSGNREQLMGSNNQRVHGQVMKSKKTVSSSSKKFLNLNKTPVKRMKMNPPSPIKRFLPSGSGSSSSTSRQEKQRTETARPSLLSTPRPPTGSTSSTTPVPSSSSLEKSSLASLTMPISLGQSNLHSGSDIANGTSPAPTQVVIAGGRRLILNSTSTLGFVYRQATDEELQIYGKNYDGPPLSRQGIPASEAAANVNSNKSSPIDVQTTAVSPVAIYRAPHPSAVPIPQADIVSRPSTIPNAVQRDIPVPHLNDPTIPNIIAATSFDNIPTPVASTHTNLSSPLLLELSKRGLQPLFVPDILTSNSTPIPAPSIGIPQSNAVGPNGTQQNLNSLPPKQASDTRVNIHSTLPSAQLEVPSPQVQTTSQTLPEDRIAERVFALFQPTVLRVAEIGKVQEGMIKMIQDIQNGLDVAEKEQRVSEEKAKHAAIRGIDARMDVDEVVPEGLNVPTSAEGKDKEDKGVKKQEDTIKSILILADRIHTMVEDLGAVKRVLGVENDAGRSGDTHSAVEQQNVVGEYATRGRKRRKLSSLTENEGTTEQEEEFMLVDGEWKPLSSNVPPKTDTNEKSRRSILDRLDSMEMDLQECLERAKDPLAGVNPAENNESEKEKDNAGERRESLSLSAPVVRHEIGTSPIKLPSAPHSVKQTHRQPLIKSKFRPNVTQDSRQKELISLGNAPSGSRDGAPPLMFATRRPNGSTTAQAKASLASLTSSSTSFVKDDNENEQNKNQLTMVEDQESDVNEDDEYDELAESDAEVVGADADQDHDVFGPLKLNSSRAASTTSDYHMPELPTGEDCPNKENNMSHVGVTGSADVVMGDGESEHKLSVQSPSEGPSITQTLTNGRNDAIVDASNTASTRHSRPGTQRSGSSKTSGFSPVDWSKEQTSAGRSRSTSSPAAQVVRITPKLKLRLHPSPPHNDGPTTTPLPLSAAVPNPLTSSRSYTPVRSYTMPTLPEGSIAELRQQALGTPYLNFDTETSVDSRQGEQPKSEGRVQMVIGADAAERMPSPESQVSKEDEDEDESMVQDEERYSDIRAIDGDGGEVATVKETFVPTAQIQSNESTVMNQETDVVGREIPVPEIEMASVRSGPSKSPSPSDNMSSPIHVNGKIRSPSQKVDQIEEVSNSEIPPPASQTTEDEAVVNSLIMSMSQSSNAQALTQLPQSPIEPLSDRNDIADSSCPPSPTQKQEEKNLFSQGDSASSHKSPLFSSPRPTTASPPPHTDSSHHEDDPEEETEENIVKAKRELNSPREVPKTSKPSREGNAGPEYLHIPSESESPPPQSKPRPRPKPKKKAVVAPEIIDIDELPTPKKAAPKQKKKNPIKRESSIISISSGSEDEVFETKAPTRSTFGGSSKKRSQTRPRPLTRGSLVKLEVFTQPTPSKGGTPALASVSSQPVASSSRSTKRIESREPSDNENLNDNEVEPEIQIPHAPSTPPSEPQRLTRSISKSSKGRQRNPSSRLRSPSKSRIPSSPLSDLPSEAGPDSESDEEAVPKSSFDINKYTAKLVDDDADIIKVKPKSSSSSAGRNTEAEVDAGEKSKSRLQNLIANRKKAKESSKALTKIKKRKRVASGGTSLGNGLEDEDDEEPVDEYDKPPLKRVKMRPEVQKGKETSAKGKGKEKERVTSRRIGHDDHSENASTVSSQSRYPLRSPQKTASTSKSEISHSSKTTAKTPRKSRGLKALEAVRWPTVQKPDFSQHIECDNCDGWYHIGCVGVESHDTRLQPSETYTCPICEAGIDKKSSPVKNVTEKDIKAKPDCARPDCLREAMKSKSKKHSPLASTVPRGRGRPRKVKIEDDAASSPGDDKYIVERFIGRWKRYVGGEGLIFEYLVKWHNYGFDEATWQSIESLEMTNPDICIDGFHKAAAQENYDLQNGDEEVVLLREAAEAGWTLERTFKPPGK